MTRHCETCTCRDLDAIRQRREREEREEAEREFVRRHSVLSEDDVAWARKNLAARWAER